RGAVLFWALALQTVALRPGTRPAFVPSSEGASDSRSNLEWADLSRPKSVRLRHLEFPRRGVVPTGRESTVPLDRRFTRRGPGDVRSLPVCRCGRRRDRPRRVRISSPCHRKAVLQLPLRHAWPWARPRFDAHWAWLPLLG